MTRKWIEKSPNFFQKLCKNEPQQILLKESCFIKLPNCYHLFGLLLSQNLSPITFKNSPIWSHVLYLPHIRYFKLSLSLSLSFTQKGVSGEKQQKCCWGCKRVTKVRCNASQMTFHVVTKFGHGLKRWPIDAVNQGNYWSLSIQWRLECFVIVA